MKHSVTIDSIQEERLHGQIALVTGANRGLGLEVCRQLLSYGAKVMLSARSREDAVKAARSLDVSDSNLGICELDVTKQHSVHAAVAAVIERFGAIDILINNAGVFPNSRCFANDVDALELGLVTNTLGSMRTMEECLPSMRAQRFGRIVNVSSGMARWVELDGDFLAYRTSKSALNSMTRVIALREARFNIKINAVCPGWTQTNMGGSDALRSVVEGAYGILLAASVGDDGPSGYLLRDGEKFGF